MDRAGVLLFEQIIRTDSALRVTLQAICKQSCFMSHLRPAVNCQPGYRRGTRGAEGLIMSHLVIYTQIDTHVDTHTHTQLYVCMCK